MGFFKRKKPGESRGTFASDKSKMVKDEISVLYENREYDEVIRKTKHLFEDNDKVPLDIMQMVALSHYHKEEYEQSLPLFEHIASEKNDIESWFNVLMSLMSSKKTRQGKEVYNKIIGMHKGLDRHQPRELGFSFIAFYYACGLNDAGLFDEALVELEDLKETYLELRITDDTFVYMRGVPFLSQTLDLAKKVFDGLGKDFSNSDFLIDLEKGIDKGGKNLIRNHYMN